MSSTVRIARYEVPIDDSIVLGTSVTFGTESTLFEMLFFSGISSNAYFYGFDFANSASPGARALLGLFVIFLAKIAR